jgi:predicted deacylase
MSLINLNVDPGQSRTEELNIAKLHNGTDLKIPVIVSRGLEDGPCILLSAGIHGDETNGVEIVRQIIRSGYHLPQRGTIICVPVVNVFGFISQTRDFPDGRDLNRMFPGTRNGSLASRFAYNIMDEIEPYIDYCIDFHTGGAKRFNYSQIRLDIKNPETLELSKIFGTKFIIDAENREKSFRNALTEKGKKVLLFEGGKSLNLDRIVTQIGIQGALKVLHHLNFRDYSKEISANNIPSEKQVLVEKSSWVRATESGMYRNKKRLGSKVKKGDILGTISDPFGTFEIEIPAPNDGYIICTNHAPIVYEGDAVVHLTTKTSEDF